MKKQRLARSLAISLFILITGLGMMAGCSNKKSKMDESGNTAMSEQQSMAENQSMDEQQSMEQGQSFSATLEGANEVPAVTTSASGSVTVTLRGDSIHVQGEFSGLSSEYVASHIHKGGEGENGSPIIPLEPTLGSDKLSGSWDASYPLDESGLSALKADSLYINVHSTEHKSGEIRGQLTSSDTGM